LNQIEKETNQRFKSSILATVVLFVLCLPLMRFTSIAKDSGELIRALILSTTSLTVVIVYYVQMLKLFKAYKKEVDTHE